MDTTGGLYVIFLFEAFSSYMMIRYIISLASMTAERKRRRDHTRVSIRVNRIEVYLTNKFLLMQNLYTRGHRRLVVIIMIEVTRAGLV